MANSAIGDSSDPDSTHHADAGSLKSKIDLPMPEITKRPGLFKLALVLFVGWLLYLAYVAYIVLK